MGKQTRFYVVQQDLDNLVAQVYQNNGTIIHESGKVLDQFELKQLGNTRYREETFRFDSFYIRLDISNIRYNYYKEIKRKCLDQFFSDVIDLSMCFQHSGTNRYEHGRIYLMTQYYNDSGELITRPKELDELYVKLKRYIRKNYRLSQTKFAYIGPHCFEEYKAGNYVPCQGKSNIIF